MKLILILTALISIGCSNKLNNKEQNQSMVLKKNNSTNHSFVVSCGSGCALSYDLKEVNKEGTVIKVDFDVIQYINEKIVDRYSELVKYIFTSNKIYEIYIEDKLITEHANGQLYESLKKIGSEINK